MTVKELIEVLSKQPQEATVEIGNGSNIVTVHTDIFEADDGCSEAICFIDTREI